MLKASLIAAFVLLASHPAEARCAHIIALIGQSNMSGFGFGDYKYSAPGSPRIFQIGRGKGVNLKVIPAKRDPLHHINYQRVGNYPGPAMNMARLYVQNGLPKGCRLILIPSARGSTPITDWLPGKRMHKDLTRRINAALKAYPKGEVVHLAWQPGEAEIGMQITTPDKYRKDMETIVKSLRKAYGKFTITIGEPPREWTKPARAQYVMAAQRALKRLKLGAFVNSEGLASNPGQAIHFSAAAQMELGERHYEAFMGLRQ